MWDRWGPDRYPDCNHPFVNERNGHCLSCNTQTWRCRARIMNSTCVRMWHEDRPDIEHTFHISQSDLAYLADKTRG